MKKFFTILTAALMTSVSMMAETAVISWNMGEDGAAASGANSITGATGCDAEGFTIAITGNTSKSWSAGNGDITYNEKTYKTLKNSNGAQNTITLPENCKASSVDFYVVTNHNSTNGILTEFAGETCDDVVNSLQDYSNPTVISKDLNNVNSFTFTFSTKQVCFIAVITYSSGAADHSKATVNSISINGVKMTSFDPAEDEYNVELEYGTTEAPVVTAVAGDDATIEITQATSVTGTATVTCTSYDEQTEAVYTLNFSVKEASTDATLKSITVGGVALAGFAANKTDYDYVVEYDDEMSEYPAIVATSNEAHATVLIDQPETFPGIVTIEVTAQDKETDKTYTITFTKETKIPIIRATHVDGKHASVKGSIGGTSEKDTQDNMKFGSNGNYWGITLDGENTFKTGDSLVINMVALSSSNTNFIGLYEEKEGTTLLWNTGITAGVLGDNSVILPEALNGKASFYIVRPDDTNKWNGSIKSISVYRKYALTIDGEITNGTVSADKESANAGDIITLTVTPAAEYVATNVSYNGTTITPVNNVYSFTMPAQAVTVTATFAKSSTGVDNIENNINVEKFMENGQLFIKKNGVVYNAQGTIMK